MRNKLENLEGLRGLMAVWVMVGHATTMAALPLTEHEGVGRILANGTFAVDVFIILSGFVISLLLARGRETYGDFVLRRFFRLFPVYWVALLPSVLLLPASMHFLEALPWANPHNAARLDLFVKTQDHFWTQLALHVPLLHGIVPDAVLPGTSSAFMGQAWSLTLEWQFYLIAPLLLAVLNKAARWLLGALVLLAACFAGALLDQPSFLPVKLHLFVAGMVSWHLYNELAAGRSEPRGFVRNLFLLGLVLSPQKALLVPWAIWTTALCAQVFADSRHRVLRWTNALLAHRTIRFLGRISYPVYCLHIVVFYASGILLVNFLGVRSHAWYATLFFALGFAGTFLLAWGVNRMIEEPMIALGKRLVHRGSREVPVAPFPGDAPEAGAGSTSGRARATSAADASGR